MKKKSVLLNVFRICFYQKLCHPTDIVFNPTCCSGTCQFDLKTQNQETTDYVKHNTCT